MKMRRGISLVVIGFATVACATVTAASALTEPPDANSQLDALVKQLRDGHPEQALKLSKPLAASRPKSAEIQALHGFALLRCGEFEQAQAQFQRAVALDPASPEGHLGLGEIAYGRFQLEDACTHMRKSLTSNHLRMGAFMSLARCLSALDRHVEAKAVLVRALDEVGQRSKEETSRIEESIKIYGAFGGTRLYEIAESPTSSASGFTNWKGHVLTPAKLDGQEVGTLHLDLGSSGSLTISRKLADKLQLRTIGTRKGRTVQQEHTADVALLKRLQIGAMVVRNVPVAIMPEGEFVGGAVGNLGNQVLRRLNVSIDYKASRLHLFNRKRADLQAALMDPGKSSQRVPFLATSLIILKAGINGGDPVPLILDSGAGAFVLHSAYFFENIRPRAASDKAGGPHKPIPYALDSLEIGGKVFRNTFSVVLDLSDLYEYAKVYYPGILGNNVFQKASLHLNFADSTLVVETD